MFQSTSLVFSGPRWVHYGQIYVVSPNCDAVTSDMAFRGHSNGLCGGGVEGGLFLTVGLHTGYVQMRVEIHAVSPPVDETWEEIVETSCTFIRTPVFLEEWGGESKVELPLAEGTYRVRYCAKGFGQAPDGNGEDGEALVESYLLLLWPDARRPDAVVKQTSQQAAYWNGGAWGVK